MRSWYKKQANKKTVIDNSDPNADIAEQEPTQPVTVIPLSPGGQ